MCSWVPGWHATLARPGRWWHGVDQRRPASWQHVPVPGPRVPRRALLLGAGLGLVVSGCGIRLEDDAPDIPLVPHRTPVPGEAALLAMVTSLSREPKETSVPPGAAQDRARTLVDALAELGVPETETGRARDAELTWSEAEDVAAYEAALRECPPGLLPLVGSLAVTRVLRGPARLWADDGTGAWTAPERAREAAADTRAAVWTLTVVAAKAADGERERVQTVVSGLQELLSRQVVDGDDDGSQAPLGYDLEDPTASAADRSELVRQTLARLTDRHLGHLAALDDDRAAAHEVVTWTASVIRLGRPWRLTVDPLPGLEG